jgi:anti-sigma B factor antagonist
MFSVDLVVRECADHLIVALRGELDLADAEEVAAALAAVAAGRGKTIVDLADLAFIDCRGAAALARAQRRVRQAGGDLLLAAPRPLVQRVFVLSRLIDVVCVHASVEQAIGELSPQSGHGSRGRRGTVLRA